MRAARRILVTAAATLGLLTAGAIGSSAALADGNGATTFTQTVKGGTETFDDLVPCTNTPATVTLTYNAVFHGTINKNGSWFTGTMTGGVNAVDANGVTYTGHFTNWFGDENNPNVDVEHSTFTVHVTGSDGSSINFHDTSHASIRPDGTIVVEFDKPNC